MSSRILVVDDEESIRFTFNAFLSDAGYSVELAESLEEALERIELEAFDAIFLDILLGRDSGIKVLQASREIHPNVPVIMATGAPEISTAAEAVRLGAFDYITKPIHQEVLLRHAHLGRVQRAEQRGCRHRSSHRRQLRSKHGRDGCVRGSVPDPAFLAELLPLERVAGTRIPDADGGY